MSQQRHDDTSGLPANTTDAAYSADECWIQPRSSRSMRCASSSASSPSEKLELDAAVRRHAWWGPVQHIGVLDLERRERRVVGTDEA